MSQKVKLYISQENAPQTYDLNASIYFWKRNVLINNSISKKDIFIMPEDRSIDIDSKLDFEIVSYLIKKNFKFIKKYSIKYHTFLYSFSLFS